MIKFEVGKTYSARSISDHDCVFSFEVVSRTEKSVKIKDLCDGSIIMRRIQNWRPECENISPYGSYSMAPTLYASNPNDD